MENSSLTKSSLKSLKGKAHALSSAQEQIAILEAEMAVPEFNSLLTQHGLHPFRTTGLEILQVNVGKVCNQTCRHCHVDAGPDRRESMSQEIFQACLNALDHSSIHTVDITGGAPEMNPHFRWFVEEVRARGKKILVRCNLTIVVSNPKYHDLPVFFRENEVEVISSLPYFSAKRTDQQRGEGVFERSIRALKMLNDAGYGMPDSPYSLNLVYNPSGAFLPAGQKELEDQFKKELKEKHGIHFHQLFTITNLPISRFLDYLLESGKFESYLEMLASQFNPAAAKEVMCRNMLSVAWDGKLHDCDFNQMLEIPLSGHCPQDIRNFQVKDLADRNIMTGRHCFGCTAGSGSSCGGALI